MFKKILIGIVVVVLAGGAGYYIITAKRIQFESVCSSNHKKYSEKYCSDIGKRAHSLSSVSAISNKDYGEILGIAWRSKGSVISSPGTKKRYSESNSYYYILGNEGSDYQYLRKVSEVEAR